jgi:hypothetical protein
MFYDTNTLEEKIVAAIATLFLAAVLAILVFGYQVTI